MSDSIRHAIAELQEELKKQLEEAAETKRLINRLCRRVGDEELYPDTEVGETVATTKVRADQFFGKGISTAVKEYLQIRNAANQGPATVKDIHSALVDGGFVFETKNEDNAKRGLRISLRKNSSTFVKLPNNTYGLVEWYPDIKNKRAAKKSKSNGDDAETETDSDDQATSSNGSQDGERQASTAADA